MSIKDSVNDRNQSLEYDALDRLKRADINSDSYIYGYSSIGNIKYVVINAQTKAYSYGNSPVHAPAEITYIAQDVSGVDVIGTNILNRDSKNQTMESMKDHLISRT